nr:hypothetical protein CFP56_75941 [Quercus suber]
MGHRARTNTDCLRLPSIRYFEFWRKYHVRQMPALSDERQNVLLVVAVLLVTISYQVVLNPPGGLWQDDVQYNRGPVFMVILSLGLCFCLSFLTINQAPVLAISLFVLWLEYTILVMVVFGLGIDRKTSKLKRLQESMLSGLWIQSLEKN